MDCATTFAHGPSANLDVDLRLNSSRPSFLVLRRRFARYLTAGGKGIGNNVRDSEFFHSIAEKTMKASELFTRALEAEGVEYIFGIPGEENLDLLDSLSRSSIHLVLTRHEQAAGFMAATYGRLTGRVGVCLSTLGPGATNFVTAAAA